MYTEAILKLRYRDDEDALALVQLLQRVHEHDGHSTRPIAAALRSIHNGDLNPVDLELVCKRLEDPDFEDVLRAMRFARRIFQRDGREMYRAFLDEKTIEKALFRHLQWREEL